MVSEGSCDTDWRSDHINIYIFLNIKIDNRYFKLQYFTKSQMFTVFFIK